LRRLVSSRQKNDHDRPLLDEVDAVARPIVNSQLGYAITDGFDVARVTKGEATVSDVYASFGDSVV